jgi:nitric oxide dioxygenase
MRGPRWGLVAPTSQSAPLFYFYGWAVRDCAGGKASLRGDGTEQGCMLMATVGVVVNSLGNLETVLPAASALAKRREGSRRPLARRCCGRWSRV